MQAIATAAFVRSLQNVKCLVLGNRLFNPESVPVLLGNFATNFLALYPFCLNSLAKTRSYAVNTILLLFTLFDCINKRHFRLSDCGRYRHIVNENISLSIFNN